MQIGSADCAGGYLDDRIVIVQDFRLIDFVYANVALAMGYDGFHAGMFSAKSVKSPEAS